MKDDLIEEFHERAWGLMASLVAGFNEARARPKLTSIGGQELFGGSDISVTRPSRGSYRMTCQSWDKQVPLFDFKIELLEPFNVVRIKGGDEDNDAYCYFDISRMHKDMDKNGRDVFQDYLGQFIAL